MKISIVTATYNSGKTIAATMQSVLEQTHKDVEYIIVDGGSTDNTLDLVRQYEPQFGGRMKWISEKDRGIYDAMNKGLLMATGDVVGTLNSDDRFTANDLLATVSTTLEADPKLDAVYGDVHFVQEDNPDKCVRYYSSRIFRPRLLRFGLMPAHPSFYCRRKVFQKAGLYRLDYKIGADYEMMVRLFKREQIRAQYIPKDFVTMQMGGASTRGLQSWITLIKEDVKACRDNGIYTNSFFICLKFIYKVFELRPW